MLSGHGAFEGATLDILGTVVPHAPSAPLSAVGENETLRAKQKLAASRPGAWF